MSMDDYPRTQLYTRHNIQHRKERNPIESYLNCKMKGIGSVMCPHISLVGLFLLPFLDETERININFPQFDLVFHGAMVNGKNGSFIQPSTLSSF